VLEAIKTGNPKTACQNLAFLVDLKLLDDTDNAIHNICAGTPKGAPSLPASKPDLSSKLDLPPMGLSGPPLVGRVSGVGGAPISGATVTVRAPGAALAIAMSGVTGQTDEYGEFIIPFPNINSPVTVQVEKAGYFPATQQVSPRINGYPRLDIELNKAQ
jgi:hypothetical protein